MYKRQLEEHFGATQIDQLQTQLAQGLGGAVPAFAEARITDRADSRATVTYVDVLGNDDTFDLLLVEGGWMIDGASLFDTVSPEVAQQFSAAMPQTSAILRSVAQRVRDGEFATVDEALQALMTEALNSSADPSGTTPPGK